MNNPFETIDLRLSNIETLLLDIKHEPKEDLSIKRYDVSEAAKIARVSKQTIRSNIKKGYIKGEIIGRKYLIPHNELFNSFQEVKSLKYKRS